MKCPFKSYFNWLVLNIYLFQTSLIFICCKKPSEIYYTNKYSTYIEYIGSFVLYPPWIFGTKTLMSDSLFFFLISIIPFLIIAYSQAHIKQFSNQKHVNFWCALVIRICQQFLTPFMICPMTFRFSYLFEQVFILKNYQDLKMIISFIIATINLLLQVIHCYFASLFLVQIDFVVHSKADVYDGKYNTLLFVCRINVSIICFELSYIQNNLIAGIIIGFVFVICIIPMFLRLRIQVHVSPFGQFLEIIPFFICPFMILFKYFYNKKYDEYYSLLLMFFLIIACAILFRIYNCLMVKLCMKTLYPFFSHSKQNIYSNIYDETNDVFPKFFFGSAISVIRIAAVEYSDPDLFLRFFAYQKKTGRINNSSLIEIVRFLAIYPSKRKDCLKMLKHFHSNSFFNCFMVFIFKKILKSLNNVKSTEKNLVCLNNFYRSFLVHKHLFWVARKNKKIFLASREGLSAAYFYIEVKNEFHYLINRYVFDSFLHYYYADFCLSACGDFEKYLKEYQIARMIDSLNYSNNSSSINEVNKRNSSFINNKSNNSCIVDPLLHPMTIVNPKILQFCSLNETKLNIHSSRNNEYEFSNESSSQKREQKFLKPVASFLNEKKYLIPFLSIFHFYFPIAAFLFIIGRLQIKNTQMNNLSDQLNNLTIRLLDTFYFASSAMYLPYITKYYKNKSISFWSNNEKRFNFTPHKNWNDFTLSAHKLNEKYFIYDDDELLKQFLNLPFNIINFYSTLEPLEGMTTGVIFIFESYISNNMMKNYTMQEVLDQIPYEIDISVKNIFTLINDRVHDIKNISTDLCEFYKNDLEGFNICHITIISICIFTTISWAVYIIQINCIYKKDQIKIDFLSSKSLFSLFLLQDSKKAWELLRNNIEHSSDAIIDSVSYSVHSSSLNLSNIPISTNNNLKEKNIFDYQENIPNQNETNNIEEPLLEMAVNVYDFNNDLRSLLNSNNLIQVLSSNYKLRFANDNQLNSEDENENENSFDSMSDENEIFVSENSNTQNYDICDQAIMISNVTEKEAYLSCPHFHLFILLSAPLIFTVLVVALFQIPLGFVAKTQRETFQNILESESLVNHSLIVLNISFDILEKRVDAFKMRSVFSNENNEMVNQFSNTSTFIELNDNKYIIKDFDEIFSDLRKLSAFSDEKCYEFFDIVCTTIETAVNLILDTSTSISVIATQYFPSIYLFTWELFRDLFFSNVKTLYLMKISNGTSFIIATVLLMLTVIHVSFSSSMLLKKAFNSLFHFPDDFLNPPPTISEKNSKKYKRKLPQNALVITSVTSTDIIYSVSDNSKEIINRNFNDLISMKMSEMFPSVKHNDHDGISQLCEFYITEKKKKTFRYSTERIGCLTKTVLIEENLPAISNTSENSLNQCLNVFIPKYFAQLYGKNDQSEFSYINNFIISVRISHEISPSMVEKCFNSANHISQNSISIHIINVDGVMITFTSNSNCKLIVILLLIRDFIDDVFKNTKTSDCIYSIYVHFMDDFMIYIVNNDELYLEFHPNDLNFFRSRLFQIEKGQIAFSEKVQLSYPNIAKITGKEMISFGFDENEESIYTIPVNSLSSKIALLT